MDSEVILDKLPAGEWMFIGSTYINGTLSGKFLPKGGGEAVYARIDLDSSPKLPGAIICRVKVATNISPQIVSNAGMRAASCLSNGN